MKKVCGLSLLFCMPSPERKFGKCLSWKEYSEEILVQACCLNHLFAIYPYNYEEGFHLQMKFVV